ncbi:MerR family transcriptional regulator [Rhizobium alvei]|uniref:Helix-turn-helix domain-containing protein n=1 Tax=Rhizobium alvei TaxID=1132659 RepID=A0ABT8YHY9_9HYPH|nr:helix-turn-helix domain-containing protein [Rhizobium alvei]MDO6963290.1 helix-turn-helix domain-containing protein [Rhizobium alvei]
MAKEMSIGELSRHVGVKVPTIRYYEDAGLLAAPPRSEGGQRRYDERARHTLAFIAHAREMGFSLEAIRSLIDLADHPEKPCVDADRIAKARLEDVRRRIDKLRKLEGELERMLAGHHSGKAADCRIIEVLSDHGRCADDH